MANKNSITKNIIILIFLSVVLKGIGFINRIVIAYFYGTAAATDIYYNVSGFVESISAIILSGLTIGIINIYIKSKGKQDSNIFISNVIIVISLMMFILLVCCSLLSEEISRILAPTYDNEMHNQMNRLLRVLVFAFPFQGLVTIYGAVLQAENRFTPIKLTGFLSSFVSILSILFFAKRIGIYALTIAFLLSYVLNAFFLRVNIKRLFAFSLSNFLKDENIRQLGMLVVPLIIGTAGHEVNLIIDKSVASQIAEGAVSALSYSCVLYLFIENVVINSIVTAIFPNMTEKKENDKMDELAEIARNAIILAEFLLIPIVICTFFNAVNITKIVYMRGSFNEYSLELTSMALKGYVIGLPFLALRDIVTRVYYSYSDTKTPVIINMISVIINIVLDFILGYTWGVMGITMATSAANIFSGVCMCLFIKKYNKEIMDKKIIREIIILILSGVISSLICHWGVTYSGSTWLIVIICAFIVFFVELIIMILFKSSYLNEINQKVGKLIKNR